MEIEIGSPQVETWKGRGNSQIRNLKLSWGFSRMQGHEPPVSVHEGRESGLTGRKYTP